MMTQPEFGIELIKIRKLKGLTQSELAEKSNVSYRTIQRIESGKVMPRSFTIRTLSSALDYDFLNEFPTSSSDNKKVEPHRFILSKKIITQTIQLFNLKTNAMKKLSLLTVIFAMIGIGLFTFTNKTHARDCSKRTNFLNIESNHDLSQKDALKLIRKINRKAKFHNQSIDLIKFYAKKSKCNYDTYVLLSKMIGSFGYSTLPAMEIANTVYYTNNECDLFNEIAPLIFLNNHNPGKFVKLAKDAAEAKTEEEKNRIREQISNYKKQGEFKTLEEAFAYQYKI